MRPGSDAKDVSLAVHDGVPFVSYIEKNASAAVTVKKFEAGIWTMVGEAAATSADYTSLVVRDGAPLVAFSENALGGRLTVMRYETGAWTAVGPRGFSPGLVSNPCLAVNRGVLYTAFTDHLNMAA